MKRLIVGVRKNLGTFKRSTEIPLQLSLDTVYCLKIKYCSAQW